MSEPRRLSDQDIDRALAGLVDGEPSRRLHAAVMQRLNGAPSRYGRPEWRLALTGAAAVVLVAAALGIWTTQRGAPQPAIRASARPPEVSTPGVEAGPRMAISAEPATPVDNRAMPRVVRRAAITRRTVAVTAARSLSPAGVVAPEWALTDEAVAIMDAPYIAQIMVTPLPTPAPIEMPPLAPTAPAVPSGADAQATPAAAGTPPSSGVPAQDAEAAASATAPPDPLHVAPITFESLKLERLDVPPIKLPPPSGTDIKGKTR